MRSPIRYEGLEQRLLFAADVHFSIDAAANVHAISRFIYGVNESLSGPYSNLTLTRAGGNRWTAYNWENNASNAGSDYYFQNDNFLGGGNTPGGAIMPTLNDASSHNAGALVTIPMAGYVSADKNGGGDVRYNGNTWNGSGWTNGTPNPNYLSQRFKQLVARKGSAFSLSPDTSDAFVYSDEFVNWIKSNYAYGFTDPNKPIFFDLDNEPDLWNSTHAEVHPAAPTYAEMVQRTTDYASAIKDVVPSALIFGPVNYGWQGYVRLQNAPDANNRDFQEFFLQQMQQASNAAGKRLLDVMDVHWYPEAHGTNNVRITDQDSSAATVAARLQAPRSLWDSSYTESSWITQFSTLGPINLINRLKTKINTYYPGTKLAISEYNYGGGNHISGAIAQADVLGILGRENVFAANEWRLAGDESFIGGAFRMFRNYDGANSTFGDTSIGASTDSVANTSVYASYDQSNRNVLTLVAINKTAGSLTAGINLSHVAAGSQANVWRLTSSSSAPQSAGTISITNPSSFEYVMPAYSISTIKINLATPVARVWTGGGDNVHWSDPANWSGNAVPTASDDVIISVPSATITTVLDGGGNVSVHSLTSDENLTINGAGSSLTVSANSTISGNLSIQNGGRFTVATNSAALTKLASSLSITGAGSKLDLNNNDLLIDYSSSSPLVAVQNLINAARAGGSWTGDGLTSTSAKDNAQGNTTLGAIESSDFIPLYGSTFHGTAIDSTAVLVKYTYYGDANFDGRVTFDDYTKIDTGFNQHRTGWFNGDFNLDGTVNFDDYVLIDTAFNTQGASLGRLGSVALIGRNAKKDV